MDLTVTNMAIAAVQAQSVQLNPILGAFELVIPLTGTVHGTTDGIYRWLTIAGGRLSMRSKGGQFTHLGRAVPDNSTVVRQFNNSSHTDFALKLTLQPYQLEKLEIERNGGDLVLSLTLLARASSSDKQGTDWEQYLGEMPIIVPESSWIAQLNQSKAGQILLLEIHLPGGATRHPSERHLLRARELLAEGEWRNCISECRQFAEELGGAKLGAAMEMLRNDRTAMTKENRETLIVASLQHYGHIATHSESKGGEMNYSRADAKLALSIAASLAEYHFGSA